MKLIKLTENHYIIVDDSEIKEGDYFLNETNDIEQGIKNYPYKSLSPDCKKITHSTEPIENYTRGDGKTIKVYVEIEPLHLYKIKELIGEVDVEEKAWKYNPVNKLDNEFIRAAYIKGYNQALEDNKEKKYTEEDMFRIFCLGNKLEKTNAQNENFSAFFNIFKETINSLQHKTQWGVEFIDGKLKLK